jgi:hypothetical protein
MKLCQIACPPRDIIDIKLKKASIGLSLEQNVVLSILGEYRKCSAKLIIDDCECESVAEVVISMQANLRSNGLFIRRYFPEVDSLNSLDKDFLVQLCELVGCNKEIS